MGLSMEQELMLQARPRRAMSPRPSTEFIKQAFPEARALYYPRDRLTTAYHEAGHAVLNRLIGVRVSSVVIGADGLSGFVELDIKRGGVSQPSSTWMLEAAALQIAVTYVGGIAAEMLLHGLDVPPWFCFPMKYNPDEPYPDEPHPDNPHTEGLPDGYWARYVLRKAFNSEAPLYYCQRLARALLCEHWGWVQAVASELDEKGILDQRGVDALGVDHPGCFGRVGEEVWGEIPIGSSQTPLKRG